MSILNKASLVITPTAHKEGKLYAVKSGLFGNDVISNGTFSSSWTTSGFSSIPQFWTKSGADDANNYIAQNGQAARIVSSAGSNVYLYQSNILTVGRQYRIKFDVISVSGGTSVRVTNGGVAVTYFTATVPGTYIGYFTATSDTWVVFGKSSSAQAIDFTVDNVSVSEDLTGDLTWTRATIGTRVNRNGYIERVPYNFLTYSEQFDNTIWGKSNSTVSANVAISPTGNLNADKIVSAAATGRVSVRQITTSVTTGNTHTASVYLKAAEWKFATIFIDQTQVLEGAYYGSGVGLNLTGGTSSNPNQVTIQPYIDGWYLATIKCTPTTANSINFTICPKNTLAVDVNSIVGDGASGIYIWGAQIVEGTQPKNYLTTIDRLSIPRINYPTTGGTPHVLIEPQRTNIFARSEEFSHSAWTLTNAVVTSNYDTSPSGIISADKLIEDTANGVHRFFGSTGTAVSGNTYTMSIYAKPEERAAFEIDMRLSAAGQYQYRYNLTALTTSQVGTSSAITTIENAGNGWYRCSITAIATATTATLIVYLSNGSTASYTGISGYGMGFWGLQFETGFYPSSYIPTTTAAATRNADTFTRGNIYTNGLVSSGGGSWYIELDNNISLTRDVGASKGLALTDNLTDFAGNAFYIRSNTSSSTRLVIHSYVASVLTNQYLTTANNVKILIRWNGSTADFFVNGTKVVSDTAFTATALEYLIGDDLDQSKYIKVMALFSTPLSDIESVRLTTL